MSVFTSLFLNGNISAILPSKNLFRPLFPPQIFTAIQLLKTATFEESGRNDGHLATLLVHECLPNASNKYIYRCQNASQIICFTLQAHIGPFLNFVLQIRILNPYLKTIESLLESGLAIDTKGY
jgi:hypothetical protein